MKNKDIDKARWNGFIDQALFPQVYAKSWMLDISSPDWGALVGDGWEWAMPLTVSRKWGIPYLLQPMFFQQLGVFSRTEVESSVYDNVLDFLSRKYPYVHYRFNRHNQFSGPTGRIAKRQTFELDLSLGYDQLRSGFSQSHRKNINKCYNRGVKVYPSADLDKHLKLMSGMYAQLGINEIKPRNYQAFKEFAGYGMRNTDSKLFFATNEQGETIGSAFFLKSGRQFVLFTARTDEGIEKRCSFALIDKFLKEESGSGCYLDFAGSDISGIADFNAGWGAKNYTYLSYSNRWLPLNL